MSPARRLLLLLLLMAAADEMPLTHGRHVANMHRRSEAGHPRNIMHGRSEAAFAGRGMRLLLETLKRLRWLDRTGP